MGYTYSEKVILVSKNVQEDYLPTYVAKFDNKQQLENAIDWSTYYDYGEYDEITKSYPNKKVIEPLINTFDNKGFKLSLLECANNSSQGGKLSFWNCIVEKDNRKFKIGINTTLLLDLFKESTFVNGVCQQPVCFVNRNGQTGMCVENEESTLYAMLTSSKFGISDSFKEIDEHTKELMDKYNFKYQEE